MSGWARYLVVQLMFAAILIHWDQCGACDETLKCEDGTEWCFDCTERDANDNATCGYARYPNFLDGEFVKSEEEGKQFAKNKTFCTTDTDKLGPKLQDFLNDVLDKSYIIYYNLEQVRYGWFTPADFKCTMQRPKPKGKVKGAGEEADKTVNGLLDNVLSQIDNSVVPIYLHMVEDENGETVVASTLKCFPWRREMAEYVIKITRDYSLSIWAIVGIVLGVLFALGSCACVVIVVIVLKKKENKRKRERAMNAGNQPNEAKKSSAKPAQEKKKSSVKKKSSAKQAEPEPEPEAASGWGAWFGGVTTPAKAASSDNFESATTVGGDESGVSVQSSAATKRSASEISNA